MEQRREKVRSEREEESEESLFESGGGRIWWRILERVGGSVEVGESSHLRSCNFCLGAKT